MKTNFNNEELEIALNFSQSIKENRLFSRNLASIDRIVHIFFSQRNRDQEEERQVIDFLFQCLDIYGMDASVLFRHTKNSKYFNDIIKRLHDEYQGKFNFDIINSSLFESVFDLIKSNENTKNFFIICLFVIPFLLFLSFFLFAKNNEKNKIIKKYVKTNKQLENQLTTVNKQLENEIIIKKQIESQKNIKTAIKKQLNTELPAIQNQLKNEISTIQSKFENEVPSIKNEMNSIQSKISEITKLIENQTVIKNQTKSSMIKKHKKFVMPFKINYLKVFAFFADLLIEFFLFAFLHDYYYVKDMEYLWLLQMSFSLLFWLNNSIVFIIELIIFEFIILKLLKLISDYIDFEKKISYLNTPFWLFLYIYSMSIIKFTFSLPKFWSFEYNMTVSIIFIIKMTIHAFHLIEFANIHKYIDFFVCGVMSLYETAFYILSANRNDSILAIFLELFIFLIFFYIDYADKSDFTPITFSFLIISSLIKYAYYYIPKRYNILDSLIAIFFIIDVSIFIINTSSEEDLRDFIILAFSESMLALYKKFTANLLLIIALFLFNFQYIDKFNFSEQRAIFYCALSFIQYNFFIAQMSQ